MPETPQKPITCFDLTGQDVQTFLNNQIITEIKPGEHIQTLTAICNPKGRVIFSLFIDSHSERTKIAVDSDLCDKFLQYVNMRRFRMDVKITTSDDFLALNHDPSNDKLVIDFVAATDSNKSPLNYQQFWQFLMQHNVTWINAESTEQHIPQHINYDQLGVISFDKGCYPGQEIIARLYFLGSIKKRMQCVSYQAPSPHSNGAQIQWQDDRSAVVCSPSIADPDGWRMQIVTTVEPPLLE